MRLLFKANVSKVIFSRCLQYFLLVLLFFTSSGSFGHDSDNTGKLIEYFAQEKVNLTLAINNTKLIQPPKNEAELLERTNQNNIKQSFIKLKIDNFQEFLANQQKLQLELDHKIKSIQQAFVDKTALASAQEQLAKLETLSTVNKKTIELINEAIKLAEQYQLILKEEKKQIQIWESKIKLNQQIKAIEKKEEEVNLLLGQLYQRNIDLQQQQNKTDINDQFLMAYESNLLINNQNIRLAQQEINVLHLQKRILKAHYLLLKNRTNKSLANVVDIYKQAVEYLSTMQQSLIKMSASLAQDHYFSNNTEIKQQYLKLEQNIKKRIGESIEQQKIWREKLEKYQQFLKKQPSSAHQTLAEYRIDSLPLIFQQILSIPKQFYNYLKILAYKVRNNYLWTDPVPAALLWASMIIILIFAFLFNQFLLSLSHNKERYRLTGYLYDGLLILIKRNIPHITLFSLLLMCLLITKVPYSNYQLLFNLMVVWLTFRTLILIARLVLLERISDASGKDVKLYYRLKWLLLAGGWATALMVISHQLPLSVILQDIFNRLFMLFILAISLVTWKSKDVLQHLLKPYLKRKKRYYQNAVKIFVLLLPLTLFTTAIIGLLGFSTLAWTMYLYQAYILLILMAYVLTRGLLFDALELISEWMISSLQNGWLWIEVLLKPLDKILRILLLIVSILLLFQLFGLFSDQNIMNRLETIILYPFINLSGVHITLLSAFEFLILLSIFIWAAKWTREFCYRWLYRNAKDAGIRNSLSVFSQYAVILIGSIITLRVLGLDFSGMSFILGGLAVGMGFGLRDFASNIIGGIMLLIERPVREGDLITLGSYEGRVAHIGIRSMRVSSWDNMEVLIPNAETFNKPFTNWTHQDNIVRTVVPVKVSRADDPVTVQQLILDVLAIIPEVLSEPPAQVFLKQIDEALIEFEVRYFINVEQHTRFEVRSKVLFAITAQFKAAGIKPPIPPLNVELVNVDEDENGLCKESTKK
ncbi:mechanosensitive ion channel domain-containing protein [Legionella israelensis]|uniref:mechanosensitive ion channel domain-containing protein n=1 Tax=Legionella israelensis TaxID=454 RepID=UPI001FCFC6DD|nr:mechanosensitive ion channel domain-containing protein [Legionella israelensis]